jgi:hypothetical protein
VAWSAWALSALLGVGVVGFSIANRHSGVQATWPPAFEALAGVAIVVIGMVGALVASRRPRNPIGWILLGFALPNALSAFAEAYAVYGLFTAPRAVPGPVIAAWVSAWA